VNLPGGSIIGARQDGHPVLSSSTLQSHRNRHSSNNSLGGYIGNSTMGGSDQAWRRPYFNDFYQTQSSEHDDQFQTQLAVGNVFDNPLDGVRVHGFFFWFLFVALILF